MYDGITERIRACPYCHKKDRTQLEYKDEDIFGRMVRFYRIRCERRICRILNRFYSHRHAEYSCNLDKTIDRWNMRGQWRERGISSKE